MANIEKLVGSESRLELGLKINDIIEYKADKNLTNTGMTTNCITEIPQRIKLELKNGILTLKAGSEVIVPNGLEADGTTPKFDYVTIESDISTSSVSATSAQRFWCVNLASNGFADGTVQYTFSGNTSTMNATTPNTYSRFYNTETNLFYSGDGSNWSTRNWSLPIALITNEPSVISSIDQAFNGFGYIGSTVWVDKGVKGLAPNGRNEDGTCKNTEFKISNFFSRQVSGTGKREIALRIEGSLTLYGSFSVSDKNYLEGNNGDIIQGVSVISVSLSNGVITSFKPKQVFRAVDYSEVTRTIMPDYDKGISVDTGYVATSDGYLYIYHHSTSDGQYLAVYITTKKGTKVEVFYSGDSGTWSTNLKNGGMCPISEGETMTFEGKGTNKIVFYPLKEI